MRYLYFFSLQICKMPCHQYTFIFGCRTRHAEDILRIRNDEGLSVDINNIALHFDKHLQSLAYVIHRSLKITKLPPYCQEYRCKVSSSNV